MRVIVDAVVGYVGTRAGEEGRIEFRDAVRDLVTHGEERDLFAGAISSGRAIFDRGAGSLASRAGRPSSDRPLRVA